MRTQPGPNDDRPIDGDGVEPYYEPFIGPGSPMRCTSALILSMLLVGCSSTQILQLPTSLDDAVLAVEAEGPATTLTVRVRKPSEGEDPAKIREALSRATLESLMRHPAMEAVDGPSSIGRLVESTGATWEDVLVVGHERVNRGKGAARGAIIGGAIFGALGFALGTKIDSSGWDDFAEAGTLAGIVAGGAVGALFGVATGYRRTVIWRR